MHAHFPLPTYAESHMLQMHFHWTYIKMIVMGTEKSDIICSEFKECCPGCCLHQCFALKAGVSST